MDLQYMFRLQFEGVISNEKNFMDLQYMFRLQFEGVISNSMFMRVMGTGQLNLNLILGTDATRLSKMGAKRPLSTKLLIPQGGYRSINSDGSARRDSLSQRQV
jgi:hypothetical protein